MSKPNLQDVSKRQPNIVFNYKDCAQKDLNDAMNKLDQFTGWKDPKDLYRFSKLKASFDRHAKTAGIWYRKILMKHCHLEPVKKNGEIVKGPDGKPEYKPRWAPNPKMGGQMDFDFRDRAAFEKDYAVLAEQEFTIKVYKWTAEELAAAGLNAAELRACAKMLEDADDDLLFDMDDIKDDDSFEPPVEMDLTIPDQETPPAGEPAAGDAAVQQ